MLNYISSRNSSLLDIEAEADVNQMNSQAERTIREHHPRDTAHQDSRQLVKGNDGHVYPKNPDTPYISRFPGRFLGSLACGSLDHVFRAFPQKSSPEMKQKLFQDL